MPEVVAPWTSPLSETEHALVLFGLATAGRALLAMLVRTCIVRHEVSGRYRPAIAASLGLLAVAALSYAVIVVKFDAGYTLQGDAWVPNQQAVWAWSARYMDWAVTVPLLMIELIAVSSLRGATVARVRFVAVIAAFLMIATGYIGAVAIDGGESFGALLTWGVISSLFFALIYVLVLFTVLRSLPALPSAARPSYRGAMILLMVTWFAYPAVVGLQGLTSGGAWVTAGQLLLCAADVIAKVGFGVLIHRVAKLRTAFDVEAGLDTHPETLWVDGARVSDALYPPSADAVEPMPVRSERTDRDAAVVER